MTEFPPRADWWRVAAARVWLPTAEEMEQLDRWATGSGCIPERALIENAGREVARLVQMRWPEGPVLALAGSGHNGADALVALRTLHAWGRETRAVRCGSRAPEPEVLTGWEIELEDGSALAGSIDASAVLLDGILGTGVHEAPREPQAAIIERANGSGLPIAAVDGPSGACFTTGRVPGACIRAALTVTLGWPKLGLLRFPARGFCGDLLAVEIGFPPGEPFDARAITAAWVREEMLPARRPDAHKGRSGYLALVAGQAGMAGAAVLAARAAIRGGVGIVRIVSDPANREILQSAVPEAIFVPWDDDDAVEDAVSWAHAIALGPGLGREAGRREVIEAVLEFRGERPVLLDADALNAWEGAGPELARRLSSNALLTPHPGELARLLGTPIECVLEDPPSSARAAAEAFDCTVLLKGAPSVIAQRGLPLRVSPITSRALATGGTGDVLSGLAGAYLAAGNAPVDAAAAALLVSGVAASGRMAPVGHAASDLPEAIPGARAEIESGRLGPWQSVLFASAAPGGRGG